MPKVTYNWKRFYRVPGEALNLSDSGFLVDPDGEYGAALNPAAIPWESISGTCCVILLGEPGIGKSEAMRSEVASLKAACQNTGNKVLNFDLRSFQTDQRLHERVFQSSMLNEWRNSDSHLYLFLDAMDECLMEIGNVASVLLEEFRELDVERMSLRIACRTAVWPRDFEDELQNLWSGDKFGVYELAPLRRIDIVEAARVHGIDPPTLFVDEIIRRAIVPLAIKPVTLQFLLNTRNSPSGMPTTQTELYAEGCRLLCEDPRSCRQPAKKRDELSADERLAVAARIAAIMMFCNRDAVWTGIDRGNVPSEDIRIRDLVDSDGHKGPDVAEDAIFHTLNTGLFSSRGISRIGWAHQTYCEYLAARFLADRRLSVETMMSLLLHPDGKVVPQLRETAAWVACLVPEAFRPIMAADPMCLLDSGAATADPADRRDLTENLLHLYESGELFDFDWGMWDRYSKLKHPNIDEQLRPYIRDTSKNVVVRRVAIMIAQTCEIATLEPDLVAVALDPFEIHEIRVSAAFAITQFGSHRLKQDLSVLATAAAGDDPDDDLKGCGLLCGWPGFLSAGQLFNALTARKKINRVSFYGTFLRRDIAADLAPSDLPIALQWTEREVECRNSLSSTLSI